MLNPFWVVKVFAPVPIVLEVKLRAMMRPEPEPCSQMALVTFRLEVHVAVPAGITTVSPFAAAAMAAATSDWDTLAALIMLAGAEPETAKSNRKITPVTVFMIPLAAGSAA